MKVPCGEGLASHTSPESCGGSREAAIEALTGEHAGRVLSSEILNSPGRRRSDVMRKATPLLPQWPGTSGSRGVVRPRARVETPHAEAGRPRVRPVRTADAAWGGPRRESLTKE